MCGIVGYIGNKNVFPLLLNGLKRLEYRGYDSAGIALWGQNLRIYKKKGKVTDLEEYCSDKDVTGTLGIGHTRWATHGEPSDRNAIRIPPGTASSPWSITGSLRTTPNSGKTCCGMGIPLRVIPTRRYCRI